MGCGTLSGDERWCDGRKHGEHKCDKARRCSRPARPLGASIAQPPRPRLILPAPPCSVGFSPHALEASVTLRSSCSQRCASLRASATLRFALSTLLEGPYLHPTVPQSLPTQAPALPP